MYTEIKQCLDIRGVIANYYPLSYIFVVQVSAFSKRLMLDLFPID